MNYLQIIKVNRIKNTRYNNKLVMKYEAWGSRTGPSSQNIHIIVSRIVGTLIQKQNKKTLTNQCTFLLNLCFIHYTLQHKQRRQKTERWIILSQFRINKKPGFSGGVRRKHKSQDEWAPAKQTRKTVCVSAVDREKQLKSNSHSNR